eukprot:4002198-Karenia_brevis.AAC.1
MVSMTMMMMVPELGNSWANICCQTVSDVRAPDIVRHVHFLLWRVHGLLQVHMKKRSFLERASCTV